MLFDRLMAAYAEYRTPTQGSSTGGQRVSFTSPFTCPSWCSWRRCWPRCAGRARSVVVLVGASLGFYATWNRCTASHWCSRRAWTSGRCSAGAHPTGRAAAAGARHSLTCNLGLLAALKYFNLVVDTLQALGHSSAAWIPFRLLFAVGISFYTFQSASYVIDVYRGDQEPISSWLTYLAFVSFFPTLLAGPITRARRCCRSSSASPSRSIRAAAPRRSSCWRSASSRRARRLRGREPRQPVFELPGMYSSLEVLAGIYAYAVQIYLDFSGYSDIAIGRRHYSVSA